MGIASFPAASGGLSSVVKSIQRGVAASSGNITITAVDTTKSMVNSFSTASTGTVAASGAISAASGTASATSTSATSTSASSGNVLAVAVGGDAGGQYSAFYPTTYNAGGSRYVSSYYRQANWTHNFNAMNIGAQNIGGTNLSLNATNLSGGTTNLVAGVNGAYLSSSTNLVVTGPCRYEVVEYY
jgi:hypothetical protein